MMVTVPDWGAWAAVNHTGLPARSASSRPVAGSYAVTVTSSRLQEPMNSAVKRFLGAK